MLVRCALALYPPAFRARHGAALQATVERVWEGRGALFRVRMLANLAAGGLLERIRVLGRRGPAQPDGRQSMRSDVLLQNVRVAVRGYLRTPGHTVVALATLGLGVGACVALFSVLNGVVLRPLPFGDPDRIAQLWTRNVSEGTDRYLISPMDLDDWRTRTTQFSSIAGFWRTQMTLTGTGADPERLQTYLATWDFFDTLGIEPVAGRFFTEDEGRPGATQVAVISEGVWRRRFGADPSIVGGSILLDGSATDVVGVVRTDQVFPNDAQVWVNINFPLQIQGRGARWLSAVGRLAPGATMASAEGEMSTIAAELARENPGDAGWDVTQLDLRSALLGEARLALFLLFGAAGVVLLISCANVAGMTLVRAQERIREIALRSSLGATNGRIIGQLFIESALLAVGGAVAGLGLAALLLRALPALAVGGLPRVNDVALDGMAALVATACIVLTGLVLGLAPAFQLRGIALAPVLTEGSRGSGGRGRARLRGAFVVAQVAAAVVLVTGGLQLARSFDRLLDIDPGFDPTSVVTMELNLQAGYPDFASAGRFYGELEGRIATLPAVQGVGLATTLPLGAENDYFQSVVLPDAPGDPDESPRAFLRQVTPDFFEVMRTPVVRGRGIEASDREDTAPIVVVNEAFVRRYLPDVDPVGRALVLSTNNVDAPYQIGPLGVIHRPTREIVGVVSDVSYADLREPAVPSVYFPMAQAPFRHMIIVVRTTRSVADVAVAVGSIVHEMDAGLPLTDVGLLTRLVDEELAPDRRNLLLMGGFGVVALLLAGIGVFGVVSWSARQRVTEFGIRLAVGAGPSDILRLVLRQALVLVGVGLGIGVLAAIPAMRLLASQLYGIRASDPVAFIGVAALLALTGLLAGLVPALRTTRMDPLEALRDG